ncbi:MAG: S9 family peptidase, partial [Flavobacteriales bacterium]|nr:S9 family peptidase [Flavobacteriales bacterium]
MKTEKQELVYPATKKMDVSEKYFGTQVSDPYIWLEDDTSSATAEWVKAQNEVSFSYLAAIPSRSGFRKRLETLWNYPKKSAPFR